LWEIAKILKNQERIINQNSYLITIKYKADSELFFTEEHNQDKTKKIIWL